jgi:hypothetical protein
MLFFSS